MSTTPTIDPILSLEEARQHLRLSNGSFAAIRPTLPVVVLGKRRRGIRLSDLQAWIAARLERAPASSPPAAPSQDQR